MPDPASHAPHLRAADADRARVAELLGKHLSAGRLTVEEYDDRLARAYAARTYVRRARPAHHGPAAAGAPRRAGAGGAGRGRLARAAGPRARELRSVGWRRVGRGERRPGCVGQLGGHRRDRADDLAGHVHGRGLAVLLADLGDRAVGRGAPDPDPGWPAG